MDVLFVWYRLFFFYVNEKKNYLVGSNIVQINFKCIFDKIDFSIVEGYSFFSFCMQKSQRIIKLM